MNTALADRAAELEAERWQPTPRLPVKPAGPAPVGPAEQARHRAELLAAIRHTNHQGA